MATKTLCDTDTVQIVTNKWLRDTRQFADNIDTLDKYGTINFALTTIGTNTQTTIVVNENIAVNTNTDLTNYPNISWLMLGSGKLTPATGVTLTLYSPDTILCPAYQQCLDASSGNISFYKGGWIHVGWFGARPTQTAANNVSCLTKLFASIPSTGSGIYLCAGTIQVSDTLTVGDKPVRIAGISPTVSILESTATATSKHGLQFTRTAHLENFQIKTAGSLDANYEMHGLRFNMDGVTAAGQHYIAKNLKIVGFNAGLYGDGGDAYNIDRCTMEDLDIQTSGPASDYVGSCIYLNRMTQLRATNLTLDQNNTGEHCLYYFGSRDVIIDGIKCRNASRSEAQAIKVVGNGTGSDDDERFPTWNIKNFDIQSCTNGIMCTIYGTEKLSALKIENGRIDDVDGTVNIPGVLFAEALGTSMIESIQMENVAINDVGYQGMHLSTAAGATIKRATMRDVTAENWSTSSQYTYTLFGTNGTGTFRQIDLQNIEADGGNNGRTIVGSYGMSTTVSRVTWRNLNERNCDPSNPGRPIALSEGDATPSMALGNDFTQGNGSAQNISNYDNLAAGQTYIVRFTTGNTTLLDGANLNLAGSTNYNPPANTVMTFYSPDGTVLWEMGRREN